MSKLIDLIPDSTAKRIGKAIFVEHKGKIDSIVEASKASESELKDPENLKKWLGVKGPDDVGKKKVTVEAFRTKFDITVVLVDYTKIKNELDKANKWMEKLAKFDPVPGVDKRKKSAEQPYQKFGKSVARNGQHQELTVAYAKDALPAILDLSVELNDLAGYLKACESVFARHKKVYSTYADVFDDCAAIFDKLIKTIPLTPAIQSEMFVHYNQCVLLASRCKTAKRHCANIVQMAKSKGPKVQGYKTMMNIWMKHLGKTLAPALTKAAADAAAAAVAPFLSPFKTMFGKV